MMAIFVFLNLYNLITLYLFKLRYLLDCYINPHKDFFNEIGFSPRYFDHKTLIHQSGIIEIIIYYRIIEKKLGDKYEVYSNQKYAI